MHASMHFGIAVSAADVVELPAPERPGAVHPDPQRAVCEHRRALQRCRLAPLQTAGDGGQVPGRSGGGA